MMISKLLFLALIAAAPNHAASKPIAVNPDQAQVNSAADLISAGKPTEAIAILDPIIASQEEAARSDTRQRYCARGTAETLFYTGLAAKEKKSAVVLDQSACYAIFLKGFALIDLNRSDEAKLFIERAVAMAPSNAQFLGELAEWYKMHGDLDHAWDLFKQAETAASFSPNDRETFDRTRGMRGEGYILIERGKLDEAEAIYRACLRIDPNDERAKAQLQYIASHRGAKS